MHNYQSMGNISALIKNILENYDMKLPKYMKDFWIKFKKWKLLY